jgi:prephenate dehydrogenase
VSWCARAAILGVGLIGGSLGLALKARGIAAQVVGWGRDEGKLRHALSAGVIDAIELDPGEAVRGADLVIFATPVGSFLQLAKSVRASLAPGALVLDVGSVKGALAASLHGAMPPGVNYVPCHPIAGGESSGCAEARADLFEGVLAIVTPVEGTEGTDPGALARAMEFWELLGATVRRMSPEEHDRIYALVSHFPHLAAYAIVNAVGEIDPGAIGYAGRGFMDTTRVALSSPDLWQEISLMNRENLVRCLEAFERSIGEIKHYLSTGDPEGLARVLARARALRETIGH